MTDNNNNNDDIAINGHGNDPQPEEPEQQQEPVECRPQDVWLGQGKGAIREHPGNVHKRALIAHHLKGYITASSQEKKDLCKKIYDMIAQVDGLFLCKKGDDYFQVTEAEALASIKSGFMNIQHKQKDKDQPKQVAASEQPDAVRHEPLRSHPNGTHYEASLPLQENVLPNSTLPLPPNAVHHEVDVTHSEAFQVQENALPYETLALSPDAVPQEPSWVQVHRMVKQEVNERLQALIATQDVPRDLIADQDAATRGPTLDPLDQLRAQLADAEAAKNRALEEAAQLRTQLEASRAQTSDAVSEADRLRQELVELSDMISVDGVSASIFQEVANAVGGDDLSAEFKSMSMEQRRKTARTANPSGSAKDASVLPGMDAGTIVTGLTDWKRSFVDLAQNLQEMGIDEKLKFKNGSYLGSVLRDKPHGLGLMRLRDRVMVANWNNGVATGQACVLYRNGGTYYGRLERNERHGEGLFIGSVKDTKKGSFKYVGSFQNDYRHGKGRFKFTEGHKLNGHEYEGNFVKGVFEGMGTHWLPNGTKESGRFVNWKLQKEDSQLDNTDG